MTTATYTRRSITTDGYTNAVLNGAQRKADSPAPLQPIEPTARPIIRPTDNPLTPEEQAQNRHAFAAFLRRPDVRQIRGPVAGWITDDDGQPAPAFCLVGAYDVWLQGGYFLNPEPDAGQMPEIFVTPWGYNDGNDPESVLGIPYHTAPCVTQAIMRWVKENDFGTTTFAEFADRLDAWTPTE